MIVFTRIGRLSMINHWYKVKTRAKTNTGVLVPALTQASSFSWQCLFKASPSNNSYMPHKWQSAVEVSQFSFYLAHAKCYLELAQSTKCNSAKLKEPKCAFGYEGTRVFCAIAQLV